MAGRGCDLHSGRARVRCQKKARRTVLILQVNIMQKIGFWVDQETKIVCTELRSQALISSTEWVYDAEDCMRRFTPASYQGYRVWAAPCVRWMRRSPLLSQVLAGAVRAMVTDIRYERGVSTQRSLLGRVIRHGLFWPANRLLGRCVAWRRTTIVSSCYDLPTAK